MNEGRVLWYLCGHLEVACYAPDYRPIRLYPKKQVNRLCPECWERAKAAKERAA